MVIYDNTNNILYAKKRRRAEARLPFPPAPRLRAFRMRETLVLDAADWQPF